VAVVAVFEGVTQEQYEETVRRITGGKSRMESPGDWPVEGLLAHITGQGPNGFRVVDVWESEEAFRRFGETLVPILQEMGVEEQPEVYPAHTFVSG
jgi:heme-degrading monooxygenase HmoA